MCLETSELRFEFGVTLMRFILISKVLNHPICLGSHSHNSTALLYSGEQRQGQSVEIKAKTDELIVMFPHRKAL